LTLKAAKGKPGLFCVHGDAFNLAPHFSGEQAVYWLSQWPKRMVLTKSKPSMPRFERIEEIAKNYLQQVKAAQPKGPYYFIAGSAAGIIIYEMGQQLAGQGEEPATLLLMDLPQGELQASTARGSARLAQILRRTYRRFGLAAIERQLNYYRAQYKLTRGNSLTDLEARNYTNGLLFRAVSNYEIKPYAGKVVYIVSQSWARSDSVKKKLAPPDHWQKLMPGIASVQVAPAAVHNDLLQGESAKFIANLCAEIIQW
ncbi:MAG: thioesterase domain-containing protein, partial [Pseudomonadales bacterium]